MRLISLICDSSFLYKVFSLKGLARLGDISGYAFLINQMVIWYVGLAISKLNYTRYTGIGIKIIVCGIYRYYIFDYNLRTRDEVL